MSTPTPTAAASEARVFSAATAAAPRCPIRKQRPSPRSLSTGAVSSRFAVPGPVVAMPSSAAFVLESGDAPAQDAPADRRRPPGPARARSVGRSEELPRGAAPAAAQDRAGDAVTPRERAVLGR